ncbi:hypothetical protein ACFWA5_39725 [Streptomyces mirabilis]|uniref:hypothetical protein n=1 Tax=Streptomyces mirabilis TaxID=68239 RepID=UPI00366555B9
MITLIIDVTHTVVAYRTLAGPHRDLSAARQAVATGLGVDDAAELLYRDWMRIETKQLINELLNDSGAVLRI